MSDTIRDVAWTHNGFTVEPGVELSVRGQRGRFRFVAHVMNEAGAEWIDCYGGPPNREQFRSFDPARITTVHRKAKIR